MRKFLALPLVALLALPGCTDQFGRPDPLATGLLGAGLGAAAGVGIAAANQPRYVSPGWGGGWGGRPVVVQQGWGGGWGSPGWGGGWGRPGWGGGWGQPGWGGGWSRW